MLVAGHAFICLDVSIEVPTLETPSKILREKVIIHRLPEITL